MRASESAPGTRPVYTFATALAVIACPPWEVILEGHCFLGQAWGALRFVLEVLCWIGVGIPRADRVRGLVPA